MPRSRPGARLRQLLVLAAAVVVVVLVVLVQSGQGHHDGPDVASGASGTVAVSALPAEAQHTLALIRSGGPFPYPRNDGVVFENREGVLPQEARGFYHEYTVVTPGSSDRGARRIIVGAGHEYYYTADHYRSFRQIEGVQ